MRDFGFCIFKALVAAPEKKDEEKDKKKDKGDHKDKDRDKDRDKDKDKGREDKDKADKKEAEGAGVSSLQAEKHNKSPIHVIYGIEGCQYSSEIICLCHFHVQTKVRIFSNYKSYPRFSTH